MKLRRRTKALRLAALIPLCVGLTACATLGIQKPADNTSAACAVLQVVRYSMLGVGLVDDVGNIADTPRTIEAVQDNNRALRSLCPEK